MPEATTLERVKPVVESPELTGFEAYIAPKDLESALVGFHGTAGTAPNLPHLELTDAKSKPVVNEPEKQLGREMQQAPTPQSGAENTQQSSTNSKIVPWFERTWVQSGLRDEALCWIIEQRLGVNCNNAKKGQ